MRKMMNVFACSAALFLAGAPAMAQTGPDTRTAPGAGPTTQQDQQEGEAEQLTVDDFVYLTALSILFDIDVSQLAANNAQNAEVKAFAERVLADRRKALEDLRSATDASGAPTELDEDNKRVVEALGREKGADFDAAYVGMMIDSQDDALALFEEFEEAAKEPRLSSFVKARVDALRPLLEEAQALETKVQPSTAPAPK